MYSILYIQQFFVKISYKLFVQRTKGMNIPGSNYRQVTLLLVAAAGPYNLSFDLVSISGLLWKVTCLFRTVSLPYNRELNCIFPI